MKNKSSFLILILTIGVFGIINTEMGIIGILPLIAKVFNVSVSTAGFLVSGFALGVAIAGPTMPLLFSNVNRKTAMMLSLGIFCISNVVSIFTHSFTILMIARIIPAFFQPVYVSMAFTMAAQAVEEAHAQQAVAKVFVGVSAGMVLGVPVTSFIANNFSFAAAMSFFAVINILVFLFTIFVVPSMPVIETTSYGSQLSVLKSPVMILAIASVIGLNAAVFGFYSYMSDFLSSVSQFSTNIVSTLLLVYGVANIVGNIIAGNTLSIKPVKTVMVVPVITFISYLVLFFTGRISILAAVLIFIVGVLAGLIANINQYLINSAAPKAPDFANGLFLTSTNLGTTIGTAVCGALLNTFNTSFTLLGSLVFIVLSYVMLLIQRKVA
ncbi:MFS transporter [Limosilactobacillus sp. WF-MT5-A]|uniref:MFS transporter n=1 Tax=Limosilactobacillus agrestis TaxID=2759748 RepID=UPI0015F8E91D|nr:MFS transporter [Limosilactobacillus agrestis]MBB1099600.1 MFS transporter [Limosilactobacillus agrestis]MCD7127230.1 MFS transporter [Limosilactobacillus agrestis]